MSTLIYFVESYTAGGADKIAKILLQRLKVNKIILFVNRTVDRKILFSGSYNKNIEIVEYNLISPMDIGLYANKYRKTASIYLLLKALDYFIRYPLLLYSIFYFYLKFNRINASHFIAHNGGYPGGLFCGTASIAASWKKNIKLFYAYHSMPRPFSFPQSLIEKRWDKYLDNHCVMICVSNFSGKKLVELRNFKTQPQCIYNGLDSVEQKQYNIEPQLKLLHVGYFDSNKNQKMVLECLSNLIEQGINEICITFVGAVSEETVYREVINLVKQKNLDQHVRFEGFQDNVDDYYYNNDVLLLASQVEGFPMAILEAMRVGMPVITTDVGGIREQVTDGKNGFLIKSGDVHAMTQKISYMYHNRDGIKKMGEQSYKIFQEKFLLETMINKYTKILQL